VAKREKTNAPATAPICHFFIFEFLISIIALLHQP